MRNLKLTVAYDGTNYHGFQRQANALTIQEVLEERLSVLFAGSRLKLAGAGRTDAGVHAWGQVVSFIAEGSIPSARIPLAARALLPPDIVVLSAEDVHDDFHARFSALSKVYCYRLYTGALSDPFRRNYAWHYAAELDVERISEALASIVGRHDFSAFRAAGSTPSNPVKDIKEAVAYSKADDTVELRFWGNGFLYHMVRNLVGTVVEVGAGRMTVQDFTEVLHSHDRHQAGMTAPPEGLYLWKVFY